MAGQEMIKALEQRILELKAAIEDIKFRKRSDPTREHPSDEYIHELQFDLRRYMAKLLRIKR